MLRSAPGERERDPAPAGSALRCSHRLRIETPQSLRRTLRVRRDHDSPVVARMVEPAQVRLELAERPVLTRLELRRELARPAFELVGRFSREEQDVPAGGRPIEHRHQRRV